MGFLAPAMPWIIQGAGMLGGALAGKKSQSNAMKRGPEEQFGLTGQQNLATQSGRTAANMLGQGQGYQTQAGNYYSTLLRGNRAAMSQAVAAPTAQLTDLYRGAERGLVRSGVRGAARDTAMGELNRQRASQIGSLITGVQPAAAGALGDLGSDLSRTGTQLTGTSANIYGNLLNSGYLNRVYARGEGEKTGKAVGGLAAEIGKWSGNKLGKNANKLPTDPGGEWTGNETVTQGGKILQGGTPSSAPASAAQKLSSVAAPAATTAAGGLLPAATIPGMHAAVPATIASQGASTGFGLGAGGAAAGGGGASAAGGGGTAAGTAGGVGLGTAATTAGLMAAPVVAWGIAEKGWLRGGEEGVKVNPARDRFFKGFAQRYGGSGEEGLSRALAEKGVPEGQAQALIQQLQSAKTMAEWRRAYGAVINAGVTEFVTSAADSYANRNNPSATWAGEGWG